MVHFKWVNWIVCELHTLKKSLKKHCIPLPPQKSLTSERTGYPKLSFWILPRHKFYVVFLSGLSSAN